MPYLTNFQKTPIACYCRRACIRVLVADAGHGAEHTEEYAREESDVNTFIPAKIGKPTDTKPSGYWRRRMATYLTRHGQRWQVETVKSMLKRLLGYALRAAPSTVST